MTPIKAIRAKCIDCCCGQIYEVTKCVCVDCPLYPYRMGHNPKLKGKGGNIANLNKSNQARERMGNVGVET